MGPAMSGIHGTADANAHKWHPAAGTPSSPGGHPQAPFLFQRTFSGSGCGRSWMPMTPLRPCKKMTRQHFRRRACALAAVTMAPLEPCKMMTGQHFSHGLDGRACAQAAACQLRLGPFFPQGMLASRQPHAVAPGLERIFFHASPLVSDLQPRR